MTIINKKKEAYEAPQIILIKIRSDIITESMIEDPNQGEWDTE